MRKAKVFVLTCKSRSSRALKVASFIIHHSVFSIIFSVIGCGNLLVLRRRVVGDGRRGLGRRRGVCGRRRRNLRGRSAGLRRLAPRRGLGRRGFFFGGGYVGGGGPHDRGGVGERIKAGR